MLKLTLTSALVVATSAAPTHNACPAKICRGTGTAVAKVPAAAKVLWDCASVKLMPAPAGCQADTAFAPAKCESKVAGQATTGDSTTKIPAVKGVASSTPTCAWNKAKCVWTCPAGCDNANVITGKYMAGYKKGSPLVAATTANKCTVASQAYAKCQAGYTAPACTGTATANVLDVLKKATCASKLATCGAAGTLTATTCPAGCTFAAAKYVGSATFDTTKIDKVEAAPGTSTDCTTENHVTMYKECISTPTCKGTATKIAAIPAVQAGGAGGTTMTKCMGAGSTWNAAQVTAKKTAATFMGTDAMCDDGCTWTAFVQAVTSLKNGDTAPEKTQATPEVAGYSTVCDTSCNKCVAGCKDTAVVPVVPAVAPSPAKSSSANAATMAAATIALSAIAAIVAL